MSIGDIERSASSLLASESGLTPIGRQPSLLTYVRSLWERRYFLVAFARSHLQAENNESRLGQIWQVLNPLLNAAVYYLIFGVLFEQNTKVPNFLSYLVCGVFIFGFTQRTILAGAKSITSNIGLVRALHFPRAVLPLATATEELLKTGTSLIVLSVIILAQREPLTLNWFQLPVILLLQLLFSVGVAFFFARLTARVRDVAQFLPFAMRIWMYMSGVMYPLTALIEKLNSHGLDWAAWLIRVNPAAVFIDLVRGSLMQSAPADPANWIYAVVWAVVAFAVGFLFFWRGEASYGRG
jgi:teichoic acid transport system permease protein